ncbi:MAG: DUF6671 family protein [Cyanobacteria bacterium J06559_3]
MDGNGAQSTMSGPMGLSQSTAVLATMHQKEQAIAPILERELGLTVTVTTDLNTDRFGTFTRDVPRMGTQLEAARRKAKAALEETGAAVAIASEGAFSPHPAVPLVACDREIVMLIDADLGIEMVGEVLSTETNYRHASIRTVEEAQHFAEEVQFPSHRLVVMADSSVLDTNQMVKGIGTEAELVRAVESMLPSTSTGTVHIETDMRAMYNPTRMGVIAAATEDLVRTIQLRCPACECPGFKVVERRSGLRCSLCHLPTEMIRLAIQRCQRCGHEETLLFPDGLKEADPAQCWNCNP